MDLISRINNIKTVIDSSEQGKINQIVHWKKPVDLQIQYSQYPIQLDFQFDHEKESYSTADCLSACQHNNAYAIQHILTQTFFSIENNQKKLHCTKDEFGNSLLHFIALYCDPLTMNDLFNWMKKEEIWFNPYAENHANCTAFDLASRRFDGFDSEIRDIILNFAQWEASGLPSSLIDDFSAYSFLDIQRIKDAAQTSNVSRKHFKPIPELNVGIPIPRPKKNDETITPSYLLHVNANQQKKTALNDGWKIPDILLEYVLGTLDQPLTPQQNNQLNTHKTKLDFLRYVLEEAKKLGIVLREDETYVALFSVLTNDIPYQTFDNQKLRAIIDIVRFSEPTTYTIDAPCPIQNVTDPLINLFNVFQIKVSIQINGTMTQLNTHPEKSFTYLKPPFEQNMANDIAPLFITNTDIVLSGTVIDFLYPSIFHTSVHDTNGSPRPCATLHLKKLLGFKANVLTEKLCIFDEFRAPEFTRAIQNLLELMVVIDDFNEQYEQHPLVTDAHYEYLHDIVYQLHNPNSEYLFKNDPIYLILDQTIKTLNPFFETVDSPTNERWKLKLVQHFDSTRQEHALNLLANQLIQNYPQSLMAFPHGETLLDLHYYVRSETIGIGVFYELLFNKVEIDTSEPHVEKIILILSLLAAFSNDGFSGLKELNEALSKKHLGDDFSTIWTPEILTQSFDTLVQYSNQYQFNYQINFPLLNMLHDSKPSVEQGFLRTMLSYSRLLEQLNNILTQFNVEAYSDQQRKAIFAGIVFTEKALLDWSIDVNHRYDAKFNAIPEQPIVSAMEIEV